jgi:hypothetical protein
MSIYSAGWGAKFNFSEWLRNPDPNLSPETYWKYNSYTTYFGKDHDDLDGAIQSLQTINHVLDTTHLTKQFNDQIVAKYKLPLFSTRANVSSTSDKPVLTPDDIQYIRTQRAADFEICRLFGIQIT